MSAAKLIHALRNLADGLRDRRCVMSRAVLLDDALFAVDWDVGVCEQHLAERAKNVPGSLEAHSHLLHAIDALQGAKASLCRAEESAALLEEGGAS